MSLANNLCNGTFPAVEQSSILSSFVLNLKLSPKFRHAIQLIPYSLHLTILIYGTIRNQTKPNHSITNQTNFSQTCADSRKLAQLHTNLYRFPQTSADLHELAQINTNLHKFTQLFTDLYNRRFVQSCSDSHNTTQISTVLLRFTHILGTIPI